jgi:hypothetical protein
MKRTRMARGWSLVVAAVLAAGCGSAVTVSGEVTYDGKPVEDGRITFLPADGKGPSVGGVVTGGRYTVKNVTPGPKVVKVEAVKQVPFARSSEEMARRAAEARTRGDTSGIIDPADLIPPDAVGNNAAVEVGKGKQTLDFHLKKPGRKGG